MALRGRCNDGHATFLRVPLSRSRNSGTRRPPLSDARSSLLTNYNKSITLAIANLFRYSLANYK